MSGNTISPLDAAATVQSWRERLADIRVKVGERHYGGESGIVASQWFSDRMDELLREMISVALAANRESSDKGFVVICVGGNGRRRPAPYSDVDLLLVSDSQHIERLEPVLSHFVRDCWDTGLQLGHSVRTPDDVVAFAREDIQFATSLIDMRQLMGDATIFTDLVDRVRSRVFGDRTARFVELCVESRRDEWQARGDSVNQLEPDVKRSPGGLRDLHLLQWVGYAMFGDSHFSTLLEQNKIRTKELAVLNQADEYLTALRLRLHCRAGLKQDVLTRDLQLEIIRSLDANVGENFRSAIEQFMHEYFSQTSRVAAVTRRVCEDEHRPTLFGRLKNKFLAKGDSRGFIVNQGVLHVSDEYLTGMRNSPEKVMDVFVEAAKHEISLSSPLRKIVDKLAAKLPAEPSRDSAKAFRVVLRSGKGLPLALRGMYETRVLDWLIPAASEIRCLMQFNQYHSYTVDEHTLKTIDEVVRFEDDESPVGSAYKSVRHKATLHMSLILHDIGKGREGDHSIIGEQIAEEVAVRLQTPENKKRMMMFLVRQHLVMPDLAFRRDITDQTLLVEFARLVGSPELLRMLYVLSVADIKAVGPDTWTDWKGDLMADLYNRTMLILSGRPINHLEQERLALIRRHVRSSIVPVVESAEQKALSPDDRPEELPEWIDRQLDALPPFYLMMEEPNRIAQDLDVIRQLDHTGVRIEGAYTSETDTVTYRVFAGSGNENGSFHKIAGVLSGLRMDILTAQSCTTEDGTLIGMFRVSDNDFVGDVAQQRIDDVCQALSDVLRGKSSVDSVFRRSGLFRLRKRQRVIAPVAPQVSIDNDCSEHHTVIDVFANDSPGLLYTLALTLFQRGLSVELTRIATNVDQVVDVFYVVGQDGRKLAVSDLHDLYEALMHELHELEKSRDSA